MNGVVASSRWSWCNYLWQILIMSHPNRPTSAQCTHGKNEREEEKNETFLRYQNIRSNMKRLHSDRDGFIKAINTFWDFVVTLTHFRNLNLFSAKMKRKGMSATKTERIHKWKHWQECTSGVCVSVLSILMCAGVLLHASSFMCPLLLLLLLFFYMFTEWEIHLSSMLCVARTCLSQQQQPTANKKFNVVFYYRYFFFI